MENANNLMKVRIFDLEHGLKEYDEVTYIRIVSGDYNLLIMQDYMPIMGEINGSVSINGKDVSLDLNDINAYYIHRDNEFNLMIKG